MEQDASKMPSVLKIDEFGNKIWRHNGTGSIHRTNGPAVIYHDGYKEWRQYGMLHREDGPAIINGPRIVYFGI